MKLQKTLLVTGALRATGQHYEEFSRLGYTVVSMTDEQGELPATAFQAENIVCNSLFSRNRLEKFPNLRHVYFTSAGTDRLLLEELFQRGVEVHPAKDVYSTPIAEWVVMHVLNIYKRTRFFECNQEKRKWAKARDLLELTGSTVVIVGFGDIGQEVAKRLRPFGVEIVGVRRKAFVSALVDRALGTDDLDRALPDADILILTTPLTKDTFRLLDERRLRLMKDNAAVINVSRGDVIAEGALTDLLREGKFSGVALDVFSEEPLAPDSDLWSLGQVVVSPHNSFASDWVSERLIDGIARAIGSPYTADSPNSGGVLGGKTGGSSTS